MMEKERAGGQSYNSENAIERLRKHALNLPADKTRSGEIEVGECEHVAFDAVLFFFVEGHDHEHGHESGGHGRGGLETDVAEEWSGTEEAESHSNGGPYDKRDGEKPVSECFLAAAFLPEDVSNSKKNSGSRKNERNVDPAERVRAGPKYEEAAGACGRDTPEWTLGVKLGAEKEKDTCGGIKKLIDRSLERPNIFTAGENRPEIAESDDGPSRRPVEEIRPALELINIGEEAGHQRGSCQQCQCDKALVGQGLGQFSVPHADGAVAPFEDGYAFYASRWNRTLDSCARGQQCGGARGSPRCT